MRISFFFLKPLLRASRGKLNLSSSVSEATEERSDTGRIASLAPILRSASRNNVESSCNIVVSPEVKDVKTFLLFRVTMPRVSR